MKKIHRILALILGLVFVLFAVFQLNDPDPQLWVTIYLIAASLSFGILVNRYHYLLFLLGAIASLIGAVLFWPAEWHGVGLNEAVKQHVEHARESLGLGIVAIVMLYYTSISFAKG